MKIERLEGFYFFQQELATFAVKSVEEIAALLRVGRKNRNVGQTLMNQDSSRSHSIFSITIESSERPAEAEEEVEERGNTNTNTGANSSANTKADMKKRNGTSFSAPVRVGKLHLVDLAGSERLAKTGATGDRYSMIQKRITSLRNLLILLFQLVK